MYNVIVTIVEFWENKDKIKKYHLIIDVNVGRAVFSFISQQRL